MLGAVGYIVSIVKKQRETRRYLVSFLSVGPQTMEWCCPSSQGQFLPQLTQSRKSLTYIWLVSKAR